MKRYAFAGTVHYRDATGLHAIETTITILAPSRDIARAILAHYGVGFTQS